MKEYNFSKYAPAVLRWAMSLVYLWFGTSQLTNALAWADLVPAWTPQISGLNASTIVQLNGTFEAVAALALALGVAVRPVSLLLAAHLMIITFNFGLTPIGVRDFGLSMATLASAIFGQDAFCLKFATGKKA